MQKVVEYRYPKPDKPGDLKVIQDPVSQIVAYSFTRDELSFVEKEKHAKNSCVYFLIDYSSENESVYVGQSSNGVDRIKSHQKNKEFWTRCILFTTDNNSFNRNYIDYLEYYFIHKLIDNSEFIITNADKRSHEPSISLNVKTIAHQFAEQIEFLLASEGLYISRSIKINSNDLIFKSKAPYNAKLYFEGQKFILLAGSEANRPKDSSKNWKDGKHFNRFNHLINQYIEDGKLEENNSLIIVLKDIPFDSPSTAANIVSGGSENGWVFFKGLNEIRNKP
jgi:hypothetical protein